MNSRSSAAPEADPWHTEPSLRLKERLAGAPEEGVVKGWLFHSLAEGARQHGVELEGVGRCLGFKDYPIRDYLEALAQAAVRVQPETPPLETLRLLGHRVYSSFAESLFGKVIIAGLGSGHAGAKTGLRWVSHVYKLTSRHASVQVTELSDHESMIQLDSVWTFPDSYHVGIFEGAARAFGGSVRVDVVRRTLSSATLKFTWIDAG